MKSNDLPKDVIARFQERIHQHQEISEATAATLDRRLSRKSFGDDDDVLSELVDQNQP
jgi:hypothetical protein